MAAAPAPVVAAKAKAKGKGKARAKTKAAAKAKAAAIAGAGSLVIDGIEGLGGVDDGHSFSKTMGQWKQKTVRSLRNDDNFRMLLVMHTTFSPCSHLERILMKCKGSRVVKFVTSTCGEIEADKPSPEPASQAQPYSESITRT